MRVVAFLAVPLLMLAGCVQPEPAAPVTAPPDLCNATQYQGLIGQRRGTVDGMMLPAGTRIINPGDPVTADYSAQRLNFEIGAGGRIEKVSCY